MSGVLCYRYYVANTDLVVFKLQIMIFFKYEKETNG